MPDLAAPDQSMQLSEPDPNADAKGRCLKRLFDLAKKERESYDREANELDQFAYNSQYKFKWDDPSGGLTFNSRISKVSQAIELMGAHLDDPTPQRVVRPKKRADDISIQRSKIEEDLLNYLVGETGYVAQIRMVRAQAIAHGCGVAWTGWNSERRLPQTVYDDDCNLYQDPFAKNPLQRKMCFRRREKPRWEVLQMYATDDKRTAVIGELKAVGDGGQGQDRKMDVVQYLEAYLATGLHNYVTDGYKSIGPDGQPKDPTDERVKYVFTEDGKLLAESPWEIPWFLDGRWPYTLLRFRDLPKSLWAPSVLATGISHIKTLNFIYTYFIKRYRFASRLMLATVKNNGVGLSAEDVTGMLSISEESPVAELNLDGMNDQKKIGDFLQQLTLSTGVQDFVQAYEIVEKQFEQETGLYEFLHYGAGATQDRTAAATQARQAATKTRIEDMRVRFNDFQSELARQEAQASRFLLNSQDIATILTPDDAKVWGDLAPPEQVAQADQMRQQFAAMEQQASQTGMPMDPTIQPPPILVDYQKWLHEADHFIESSYARRKDLDQRIDSLQELNNQVNPQLLQSPDPNERALAFDNMAMLFDARGVPDELVKKLKDHADQLRSMAMMQQQQAAMQPPAHSPQAEPPGDKD